MKTKLFKRIRPEYLILASGALLLAGVIWLYPSAWAAVPAIVVIIGGYVIVQNEPKP